MRRTHVEGFRRTVRAGLRAAMAGVAVGLLAAPPAVSGPRGERVVKGRARVERAAEKTRIKASDGAVIEWDSFDVGRGEKVRFVQPGRDARVLNRVDDSAPTRIQGSIKANGQVYIVNSAGVYLDGEAVVEVARLVAAAGLLRDEDFRAGRDRFRHLRGDVENSGRVEADAIALVGQRVANQGQLSAAEGDVALVAGDQVWLGRPDGHVLIRVGDLSAAQTAQPAVENSGTIEAPHGRARLAAGDGLSLALREASQVRARRISVEAGSVDVSGSLDASDPSRGARGGHIEVLGDSIRLMQADVDASGDAGGGRVRIGGGIHGGEGLRRADVTAMDQDSSVHADALRRGDGGDVAVWSDAYTFVGGAVTARAGERGGNGGFVETSSKGTLQVLRAADASAAKGQGGLWLLDPSNIRIIGTKGSLDGGEGAKNPIVALFQSDGPPATVSNTVIEEALGRGNSVLVTTDTFNAEGDDIGNISVEAPIEIQNPIANRATLFLLAANDIDIQQDITVDPNSVYKLDLVLVANDNQLGPISQGVDAKRQELADINGDGFPDSTVPPIQPELNQEQKGLVGNPNAELGDLTIEDGVQITTGGGSLQGQGRNVNLQAGSLIQTGGGTLLLVAVNPVGASDRVTKGSGNARIKGDIDTDGGIGQIRAGGVLNIQGTLDFQDSKGDGSNVVLDGETVRVEGPILAGSGGLDLGRIGVAGYEDTAQMTITPGAGGIQVNGPIRLLGGDQTIDGTVAACAGSFACEEQDLTVNATSLTVPAGASATLQSGTGGVTVDLDHDLVADGELDVLGVTQARIRTGRNLKDAVRDPDYPDRASAGSITLAPGQGSELSAEEVILRAGQGLTNRRDELAVDDPTNPKINATVSIPDDLVDPATQRFTLAQDTALDDAGAQPIPTIAAGGEMTLRAADSLVTLQDPGTPAKVAGLDLKLRGALTPTITQLLEPDLLAVDIDGDLQVDATLAASLRPVSQLTLHGGASGDGNLVLVGSGNPGAPTVIASDNIVLHAGDGPGTSSKSSAIEFSGGEVVFQRSAGGFVAGVDERPDSLLWRQDATIDATTITPDAAGGITFDQTLGPGLLPLALGFRSDDGSVQLVDARDQVGGADRDLALAATDSVQVDPANPFLVRTADVGGVAGFDVTQNIVDGFSFADADQSSITLRAALGKRGNLTFSKSGAQGVQVSANTIRLEAVSDSEGNGGGKVIVDTGDAALNPVFQGPGGAGTNPLTFVFHQTDALTDAQLPDVSQFGVGSYPAALAVRSEFVPVQGSGVASVQIDDLSILPQEADRLLVLSGTTVEIDAVTPAPAQGSDEIPDPVDLDFANLMGQVVLQADNVLLTAQQSGAVPEIAPTIDASANLWLDGFDADTAFVPQTDASTPLSRGDVFPDAGTGISPISVVMEQEGAWSLPRLPTLAHFGSQSLADNGQTTGEAGDPLAVSYQLTTTRDDIDVDPAGDLALLDRINGANLVLKVDSNPAGVSSVAGSTRSIRFGSVDYQFEELDATAQRGLNVGENGPLSITALEQLRLKAGGNGRGEDANGNRNDLVLTGDVDLAGETIRLLAGNGGASSNDAAGDPPRVIATDAAIDFAFTGEDNVSLDDTTRLVFRQDAAISDADLPDPAAITVSDGQLDELRVVSEEGAIVLEEQGRLDAHSVTLTSSKDGSARASRIEIRTDGLQFEAVDPDDEDPPTVTLEADDIRLIEESANGDIVLGGTSLVLNGRAGTGTRPRRILVEQNATIQGQDTLPGPTQLGAAVTGAKIRLVSDGGDVVIDDGISDRVLLTRLRLTAAGDVVLNEPAGDREATIDLLDLIATPGSGPDDSIVLQTWTTDDVLASVRTLGDQTYEGNVDVAVPTTLAGGTITFQKDVDADETSSHASDLTLESAGTIRLKGNVGTRAPLDLLQILLESNPAMDARLVLGRALAAPSDLFTIRTSGDLRVSREDDDDPKQPVVQGMGGSLALESDDGRVLLGPTVKLATLGALRIESHAPDGVVEVNDLAVAGRLALAAPQVRIRRRQNGRMIRADWAEVQDSGTLIVSNGIDIQTDDLALSGKGRDPLFGLPDPLDAPAFLRNPDGTLTYPVAANNRQLEPIGRSDLLLSGTTLMVMLRPEGPRASDLASDQLILPHPTRQPMPVVFAALDEAALDTVGIALRSPTPLEIETQRGGEAIWNDVRPLEVPVHVASRRLLAGPAEEAAAAYHQVFGENGENAPRLREILQSAVDHYRRDTRARRVVGFEFRRYVKNRPNSEFAAHQAMEALDRLFSSHRNSGLSVAEYRKIQAVWLDAIKPEGIDRDELSEAIHPSRYVRGSDILDIFGD